MPERNVPVFNQTAEAHAMQALNAVMMLYQTSQRGLGPESLTELQARIADLVDCTFPVNGTSTDFAGAQPLAAGQYVHPIKVAEAAVLLGRELELPRSRLIVIAMAASLMNVGYLLLKQLLIDEPRKLAEGEWEQQVKTHPALSVSALTSSGLPHEAIVAIGQHHERWDGAGYPHGVRGEEISLEARILAIADTFISLRSFRPYRPALPANHALEIIEMHAGEQFDPELAARFIDTMRMYEEKETQAQVAAKSSTATQASGAAAVHRDALERDREERAAAMRDQRDAAIEERIERARAAAASHFAPRPATVAGGRYVTQPPPRRAPSRGQRRRARASREPAAAGLRRRPRSLFEARLYVHHAVSGEWL